MVYADVVSKGMIIVPNMASVLSDEGHWKFPHEFNPENFLDDRGEFVKPEAFVPFSMGGSTNQGTGYTAKRVTDCHTRCTTLSRPATPVNPCRLDQP